VLASAAITPAWQKAKNRRNENRLPPIINASARLAG